MCPGIFSLLKKKTLEEKNLWKKKLITSTQSKEVFKVMKSCIFCSSLKFFESAIRKKLLWCFDKAFISLRR